MAVTTPVIDYTSKDWAILRADMIALIPTFAPKWTDRNDTDFGIVLINLFAYAVDILNFYQDRIANEMFLPTATQRQNVINILRLIDFELAGPRASSLNASFGINTDTTVVKLHQISDVPESGEDAVIYETDSALVATVNGNGVAPAFAIAIGATSTSLVSATGFDIGDLVLFREGALIEFVVLTGVAGSVISWGPGLINAYTTAVIISANNVTATQGTTVVDEILGSSDSTKNQRFTAAQSPVIQGSPSVEVNDGVSFVLWTEVDHFRDSTPSSEHYIIERDDQDRITVEFGDGVRGKIPVLGVNNIRSTYRIGGGAVGNKGPQTVTVLVSVNPDIDTVNNFQSASGGEDAQSTDDAKELGPLSLRSRSRSVTDGDYVVQAKLLAGVAKAVAQAFFFNVARVFIAPSGGGAPSQILLDTVKTDLDKLNTLTQEVEVFPVTYRPLDITALVFVQEGFSASDVKTAVENAIGDDTSLNADALLAFDNLDFGLDVALSDIFAAIEGVDGVESVDLTLPLVNLVVEATQIAQKGTILVTTSGGI